MRPALPILLCCLLSSTTAWAIDLMPGDIRAPRPGLSQVQLGWQYSERGANYVKGEKQPGDPKIVTELALIRVGHAFEVSNMPAYAYMQTPIGQIQPKGDLAGQAGDSGMGDTSLLFAVWPYTNHEAQTYFALGSYLTMPTGSYSNERRFNLGENRYRTALQAGYQTLLSENLSIMAAADVSWFGKNDEFGAQNNTLEQRALYAYQVALRYQFTPNHAIAAGYFYTEGGERRLNDRNLDDVTRLHRYQLTAIANSSLGLFSLQYGGDLKTENGPIELHRLTVRWSRVF